MPEDEKALPGEAYRVWRAERNGKRAELWEPITSGRFKLFAVETRKLLQGTEETVLVPLSIYDEQIADVYREAAKAAIGEMRKSQLAVPGVITGSK